MGATMARQARQEQAGIRKLSTVRLRMIFEALEPEDQDPCRMPGPLSAKMMPVQW